jgi:hypothetical protein
MQDSEKTRDQLISELGTLSRQAADVQGRFRLLESAGAERVEVGEALHKREGHLTFGAKRAGSDQCLWRGWLVCVLEPGM